MPGGSRGHDRKQAPPPPSQKKQKPDKQEPKRDPRKDPKRHNRRPSQPKPQPPKQRVQPPRQSGDQSRRVKEFQRRAAQAAARKALKAAQEVKLKQLQQRLQEHANDRIAAAVAQRAQQIVRHIQQEKARLQVERDVSARAGVTRQDIDRRMHYIQEREEAAKAAVERTKLDAQRHVTYERTVGRNRDLLSRVPALVRGAVRHMDTAPRQAAFEGLATQWTSHLKDRVRAYDPSDLSSGRDLEREVAGLRRVQQVSGGTDMSPDDLKLLVQRYNEHGEKVRDRLEVYADKLEKLQGQIKKAKSREEANRLIRQFNSVLDDKTYRALFKEAQRLFGKNGTGDHGSVARVARQISDIEDVQQAYMLRRVSEADPQLLLDVQNARNAQGAERMGWMDDGKGGVVYRARTDEEQYQFQRDMRERLEAKARSVVLLQAKQLEHLNHARLADPVFREINSYFLSHQLTPESFKGSEGVHMVQGVVNDLLAQWEASHPRPAGQMQTQAQQDAISVIDQMGVQDPLWDGPLATPSPIYDQPPAPSVEYRLEEWSKARSKYKAKVYHYIQVPEPGLLDQVASIPGVEGVLNALGVPLASIGAVIRAVVPGEVGADWQDPDPVQTVLRALGGGLLMPLTAGMVNPITTTLKPVLDSRPSARARQAAAVKALQDAWDGGDWFAMSRALNEYGQTPFQAGDAKDVVNLVFQLLADPLNVIPLNFLKYPDRLRHAIEVTQGSGRVTRYFKAAREWRAVSDVTLDLKKSALAAADAAGVDPVAWKQFANEQLAGIKDPTEAQQKVDGLLERLGLKVPAGPYNQLVEESTRLIQDRLASEGKTFLDQQTRRVMEREAKRAQDEANAVARRERAAANDARRAAAAQRKLDEAAAADASVRARVGHSVDERVDEQLAREQYDHSVAVGEQNRRRAAQAQAAADEAVKARDEAIRVRRERKNAAARAKRAERRAERERAKQADRDRRVVESITGRPQEHPVFRDPKKPGSSLGDVEGAKPKPAPLLTQPDVPTQSIVIRDPRLIATGPKPRANILEPQRPPSFRERTGKVVSGGPAGLERRRYGSIVGSGRTDIRAIEDEEAGRLLAGRSPSVTGDTVYWMPNSIARETDEAKGFIRQLDSADPGEAYDAYRALQQMAHDEWQQTLVRSGGRDVSPGRLVRQMHAFTEAEIGAAQAEVQRLQDLREAVQRTSHGITDENIGLANDAYHTILEDGQIRPAGRDMRPDERRGTADGFSMGQDASLHTAEGSAYDYYRPFSGKHGGAGDRPPHQKVLLDSLNGKNFAQLLMQAGVKWGALGERGLGAFAFRKQMQSIFEVFHYMRVAHPERLDLFHDVAVRMAFAPVIDEMTLEQVVARFWLLMESRAGMAQALPFDVANLAWAEVAPMLKLHPGLSLSMVSGPYITNVAASVFDVNPVFKRMVDSRKTLARMSGDLTKAAEPEHQAMVDRLFTFDARSAAPEEMISQAYQVIHYNTVVNGAARKGFLRVRMLTEGLKSFVDHATSEHWQMLLDELRSSMPVEEFSAQVKRQLAGIRKTGKGRFDNDVQAAFERLWARGDVQAPGEGGNILFRMWQIEDRGGLTGSWIKDAERLQRSVSPATFRVYAENVLGEKLSAFRGQLIKQGPDLLSSPEGRMWQSGGFTFDRDLYQSGHDAMLEYKEVEAAVSEVDERTLARDAYAGDLVPRHRETLEHWDTLSDGQKHAAVSSFIADVQAPGVTIDNYRGLQQLLAEAPYQFRARVLGRIGAQRMDVVRAEVRDIRSEQASLRKARDARIEDVRARAQVEPDAPPEVEPVSEPVPEPDIVEPDWSLRRKELYNQFMVNADDKWLSEEIAKTELRIKRSADPVERQALLQVRRELRLARAYRKRGSDLSAWIPSGLRDKWAQRAARRYGEQAGQHIAPRRIAVFGRSAEAIDTEAARVAHRALYNKRIVTGHLAADLSERFEVSEWEELNGIVQREIQKVQGKSELKTARRRAKGQPPEAEFAVVRDREPDIIAAKERGLAAFARKRKSGSLTVEEYDQMRTVLEPAEGRRRRALNIVQDIGGFGAEDFDGRFMAARQAEAMEEGAHQLRALAYENPGMSLEDLWQEYLSRYKDDGVLRADDVALSDLQHKVLQDYFTLRTGVRDLSDQDAVAHALQAHGTAVPMDSRTRFAQHQQALGAWNPRSTEQSLEKGAWSLESERDYWMGSYGVTPAWVDPPEEYFHSLNVYQKLQRAWGMVTNEGVINERIGLGRKGVTAEHYGIGAPELGIEARADLPTRRKWAIERFGSRVWNGERFTAMPWLMTREELLAYAKDMVAAGRSHDLGNLIIDDREYSALVEALSKELDREYPRFLFEASLRNTYLPGGAVPLASITIEDIHVTAFRMASAVMQTRPWQKFWRRDLLARGLDTWSRIWRASVMTQGGFLVSNAIDNPLKTLVFRLNRAGGLDRYGTYGRQLIPDLESLGLGGFTSLSYEAARRGLRQRLVVPRSLSDLRADANAGLDSLSSGLAGLAGRFENPAKLGLAQDLAGGMERDLGPMLMKRLGDREAVDLIIKTEVKKMINRLYPTLENAGSLERLMNELSPFFSYTIRNHLVWLGELVHHPVWANRIRALQDALTEHNRHDWESGHPGQPMPEELRGRLVVGEVEGVTYYLDPGFFSDSERGLRPLYKQGRSLGDTLYDWFRLQSPQQIAVWHLFTDGVGLSGQWKWVRQPDGTYQKVLVPAGAPWSGKPVTWEEMFWPQDVISLFSEMVQGKEISADRAIGAASKLLFFQSLGTVTPLEMAQQAYFDMTPARKREFLKTPVGQQLLLKWATSGAITSDFLIDPTLFDDYSEALSNEQLRATWLHNMSQADRDALGNAWDARSTLEDKFDRLIEGAPDQAARDELKVQRRTELLELMRDNPLMVEYDVFGRTGVEFNANQGSKSMVDEQMDQFYAIFGEGRGDVPYKEWAQSREIWLRAHPLVRARLIQTSSDFDRQTTQMFDRAGKILDRIKRRDKQIDALREAGRYDEAERLYAAQELDNQLLRAESIGQTDEPNVPNRGFELVKDWSSKIYETADPEKKAKMDRDRWYNAEMRKVIKQVKAGGEFDGARFVKLLKANPKLLRAYFDHNPGKEVQWRQNDQYFHTIMRYGSLKHQGKWDEAQRFFDRMPEWMQARYFQKHGSRGQSVRNVAYMGYMQRWMREMDRSKTGGFKFFDSMPKWVKDQYFAKHPGSKMRRSVSTAYTRHLDRFFQAMDRKDYDSAEHIWKTFPSWVRRKYLADNPDSSLRDGWGSPGGGTSGYSRHAPSAQYREYGRYMKRWVDTIDSQGYDAAKELFRTFPKWVQDQYIKRHPDKALMAYDDRMIGKLVKYFEADEANQAELLSQNPDLVRWLHDNDSEQARNNAILYLYQNLPNDPWLKRVFREKYPEVFSDEAKGQQRIEGVLSKLGAHPELQEPFLQWLEKIWAGAAEAQKHTAARPRAFLPDRPKRRKKRTSVDTGGSLLGAAA